jgi:hypothetical protein
VPCDPDCETRCHEAHAVRWKREHEPEACPSLAPAFLSPPEWDEDCGHPLTVVNFVPVDEAEDDWFYEDDEPIEKIRAIVARPPDGVTRRPGGEA